MFASQTSPGWVPECFCWMVISPLERLRFFIFKGVSVLTATIFLPLFFLNSHCAPSVVVSTVPCGSPAMEAFCSCRRFTDERNEQSKKFSLIRYCFLINGQAGIWTWVTPHGSQTSHFADKPIEIPRSLAHWLQVLEPTPEEQPLPLVSSLSSASWYNPPRTCYPHPLHTNPCLWFPQKHRWFQTPSTLIANISALDPTISYMEALESPAWTTYIISCLYSPFSTYWYVLILPHLQVQMLPIFQIHHKSYLLGKAEVPELCRICCSYWGIRIKVGKKEFNIGATQDKRHEVWRWIQHWMTSRLINNHKVCALLSVYHVLEQWNVILSVGEQVVVAGIQASFCLTSKLCSPCCCVIF